MIKIEDESRRAPHMKATGKYWPTKLYSTKFSSRGCYHARAGFS